MESDIYLFSINPPWFSEIIVGRRGLRRAAKTLVNILYEELQRDMG